MNPPTNPPASSVPATRTRDIRDLIASDKVKSQIALALPKHMTSDRMCRVALTTINRTPKLLECTQESVLSCLMTCSQLGLEPDGRLAHLIPYGKVCTLIIDYKGLVALVRRSGEVSDISADVVCEHDVFDFHKGMNRGLTHTYDLRKARGAVIGAYSYVVPRVGADSFEIMTVDEIEAIRARSRSKDNGPWVTDWNEMAKKTVFRRHAKWLPFSSEVHDAMQHDGDTIDIEATTVRSSKPVFTSTRQIAPPAPPPEPPPPAPAPAPEPEPEPEPVPATAAAPPNNKHYQRLIAAQITCDEFTDWLVGAGRYPDKTGWGNGDDYADIPPEVWAKLDDATLSKCLTIYTKPAAANAA